MQYPKDLQALYDRFFKPAREDAQEGQGLVEYALILLLVVIVVIAILVVLGPQIGSLYSAISKGFKR